jgi:hypothetical protein
LAQYSDLLIDQLNGKLLSGAIENVPRFLVPQTCLFVNLLRQDSAHVATFDRRRGSAHAATFEQLLLSADLKYLNVNGSRSILKRLANEGFVFSDLLAPEKEKTPKKATLSTRGRQSGCSDLTTSSFYTDTLRCLAPAPVSSSFSSTPLSLYPFS